MAGIKMLPSETKKEYWERVDKIIDGLDQIVRVNGQIIARFPAKYRTIPYAADELSGIIKGNYDLDEVKTEALRERYGFAN